MKKQIVSLLVAFSLLAAGSAFALGVPIASYWDFDATSVSAEGLTGMSPAFTEFTYTADTTSYISSTGAVIDNGNADVGSLLTVFDPGPPPTGGTLEPLIDGTPQLYEVTISWEDLLGQIVALPTPGVESFQRTNYSSGTFVFDLDASNNASLGASPNSGSPPFVGSEDDTGFGDGTAFATVEITEGFSILNFDENGVLLGGSYNLTGAFKPLSAFADNFWFEYGTGDDLREKYVNFEFLFATTNGDNDPDDTFIVPGTGTYVYNGDQTFNYAQRVYARHDSSAELFVVPEPSTFLLLGCGLLGLGFIARRRKS